MTKFWMVLADGTTYTKHRHVTKGEAIQEAERLAALHHGTVFFVLEAISASMQKNVTTMMLSEGDC